MTVRDALDAVTLALTQVYDLTRAQAEAAVADMRADQPELFDGNTTVSELTDIAYWDYHGH